MSVKRCAIDGCNHGGRMARGWCMPHYNRWRKHGDPLGGGTMRGEPERFFREVVLAYESDECLIWPFGGTAKGYPIVHFAGRPGSHYVHRLACEHRNGPAPTPDHQAAHSCGRGTDGCVNKRHVRWATNSENQIDRIEHGTSNRGERHPHVKLTEADVRAIRASEGIEHHRLTAERFDITAEHVRSIQRRKAWAWLDAPAVHSHTPAFAGLISSGRLSTD